MIYETIITTVDAADKAHVAPFGIQRREDLVVISPYRPSTTLENILSTQAAVMNLTDDVRVFAGAVTRVNQVELARATKVAGYRLKNTLAHQELLLLEVIEDAIRPQLVMQVVHQETHQAFAGFNRAQAAVIELAVLTTRLSRLPKEKVLTERQYLQIAIDKTAGARELEAWQWLVDKIDNFYAEQSGQNQA
jgi:uncharacterized protein